MDVGVYGENGALAGEEEDAGGGFGADPAEALQPGVGLVEEHVVEEVEVEAAMFFFDALEDLLDARGLLFVEGGTTDCVVYFGGGGVDHLLPVGEAAAKLLVGSPGLGVGGAVGEHSLNEGAEGVEDGPVRLAVLFAQEGENGARFGFERVFGNFVERGGYFALGLFVRGAGAGGGPFFALFGVKVRHL